MLPTKFEIRSCCGYPAQVVRFADLFPISIKDYNKNIMPAAATARGGRRSSTRKAARTSKRKAGRGATEKTKTRSTRMTTAAAARNNNNESEDRRDDDDGGSVTYCSAVAETAENDT